ncbi:hypothetical protein [Streptomyces griseofuscus]|uniref:hypothetical protein n=1 Tax=Streptomyces griseofuscus TaxID=146922 RepID=UPI0038166241
MSDAPAEEENTTVEFTFDFTEQQTEPVELLPEAGADRPPLILARSEPLMPIRYRPLA